MTQSAPQVINPASSRLQVALVGNPNTGKSALFNRLTGARQRVGNFPGLTIEKTIGTIPRGADQRGVDVLDLPGLYSMAAISADEQVVLDVLTGHMPDTRRPDVVVCVLDATNLRRNLFLATQIAETGLPMVIALNMWDEAEAQGQHINVEALSEKLGVPVIPTVASRSRGMEELKQAIDTAADERPIMRQVSWPKPVEDAADTLADALKDVTDRPLTRIEVRRLLFDVESALADELHLSGPAFEAPLTEARAALSQAGYDPAHVETSVRYDWIDGVLEGAVGAEHAGRRRLSEWIDRLMTHKVFGLLIFAGIMYLVFQSLYTFAGPFMDAIELAFGSLGAWVGDLLSGAPMLQSLVVDGVIAGVGGVLVFLPQIVILFLFIALLEDAGYMPRAAFLMDRLFGWCGLSGKSFVPMLSSYACAVPGVMATRSIAEPKARLATILVCPLMSCSARLPVYVLLIGAFIEPVYGAAWAGFTLFVMHFVGLAVAVPLSFLFNRVLLRGRRTPFLLEMPPYRLPTWRDVSWRVYSRARAFIIRAGTVIFAMSIVIWAMCYFPRSEEVGQDARQQHVQEVASEMNIEPAAAEQRIESDDELAAQLDAHVQSAYLEQSYMGRLGRFVQPAFAPAGFDWKITVGVLASFPAREVIISTLGILYQLGADVDETGRDLSMAMAGSTWPDGARVFTPSVAIAIMVFFALCSQCMATLATIARESNWRWAVFCFAYMTALAWVGAVVTYQAGSLIFGA